MISIFLVFPLFMEEQAVKAILLSCFSKMSTVERIHYIQELGAQKNTTGLRIIYNSGLHISEFAATTAASLVKDREIVAFCASFPINSSNWCCAFATLERRPKRVVLPYIMAVCVNGNAKARSHCYQLCWLAGWDELIALARADSQNATEVRFGGPFGPETLGEVAQRYIRWGGRKRWPKKMP